MTSIDNWFYGPLGSTSRLALHMYLIVHCDGFRLILTSKYFQHSLCLSHTSCLSAQFSQPTRESCPRFRLLHSAKTNASQSHFPCSESTLCTCCPQLETLIYLHTLDLLLQLKPGRISTLKMHLVEPAPREMPVGASSTAGREISQERTHLRD